MPNREEKPMCAKNITATEIREREKAMPPMKEPILEWLVDRELKALEQVKVDVPGKPT
jgi:hypothetical protein